MERRRVAKPAGFALLCVMPSFSFCGPRKKIFFATRSFDFLLYFSFSPSLLTSHPDERILYYFPRFYTATLDGFNFILIFFKWKFIFLASGFGCSLIVSVPCADPESKYIRCHIMFKCLTEWFASWQPNLLSFEASSPPIELLGGFLL